jgi:hypothetical protein
MCTPGRSGERACGLPASSQSRRSAGTRPLRVPSGLYRIGLRHRAESRRGTYAPRIPRPAGHRPSDRRPAKPAPSRGARLPFHVDRRVVRQVQDVGPEGVAEHLGAWQADRRERAPQPEHNPAQSRRPRPRKILAAPKRFGPAPRESLAGHDGGREERKGHPPQRPRHRLGELRSSGLYRQPPEKGDVHLSRHPVDVTLRNADVAGPVLVVHPCTRDALRAGS